MATPPPFQPTTTDKVKTSFVRNIPFLISRFLFYLAGVLIAVWKFLVQMLHDAIDR